MSQAEFHRWFDFYQLYPFDDLHRYHRPAALISRSMSGADIGELIEWLQPRELHEAVESGYSEADLNTFKAFGMKPPRRT